MVPVSIIHKLSLAIAMVAIAAACGDQKTLETTNDFVQGTGKGSQKFAGATIVVVPPLFDFGPVNAGGTEETEAPTTVFLLKNSSDTPLYIESIGGIASSAFTMEKTTCPLAPSKIKEESECEITVKFSPTASGKLEHSFVVKFGDEPSNILFSTAFDVSGIGIFPESKFDIDLVEPKQNISNVRAPTFAIAPVKLGDVVSLHLDQDCSDNSLVGQVKAERESVNIQMEPRKSDGIYNIYASVRSATCLEEDTTGEGETCDFSCIQEPIQYTLDTIAPDKPGKLEFGEGFAAIDNSTQPRIEVSGADKDETVYLYLDSLCKIEAGSTLSEGGKTSVKSKVIEADGAYKFHAAIIDQAGNVSECSDPLAYELDTVPPLAPSKISLKEPKSIPAPVPLPTFLVEGLAVADFVRIFVDPSCQLEIGGITVAKTSQTVNPASPLEDGVYTIYTNATDPAGNTSDCTDVGVSYILDTQPPLPPSAVTVASPSKNPAPQKSITIKVSGLQPEIRAKVFADSLCENLLGEALSEGPTVNIPMPQLTADGTYDYFAQAIDPAGNKSTCSQAFATYPRYRSADTADDFNAIITKPVSRKRCHPNDLGGRGFGHRYHRDV